ncbi:MAG: type II toxin-antitoxin system RelE/ParE family toxin [Chloroflexia bacterium]|nr:type II toxin-antitoxin system RelE/ParE family toxin [Chloroflexia bacterium]
MPLRVELIDEAIADLVGYAESGNLPLFLKKLIRLEEIGKETGQPLGGGLTDWRKIVVGDRNWRIIFSVDSQEIVATVWVVGDRDDAACYTQAQRRVVELGEGQPHAASLAAVMFQLNETRRVARRKGRRQR